MNKLGLIIILISLFACDNAEDEKFEVINGYLILNQGSNSGVDYFNTDNNQHYENVISRLNNGYTMPGYSEYIYQDVDYFYATLQGSYGTGNGAKLIVLDKKLKVLTELTSHPANYNMLYLIRHGTNIYISYSNSAGNYKLGKFLIINNAGVISLNQIGDYLDLDITEYGYGKIFCNGTDLFLYDADQIQKIAISDLSKSSIKLLSEINDLALFNFNIYAAVINYTNPVSEKDDIKKAGIYIFNSNLSKSDSLLQDSVAYTKLLVTDGRLFGIKVKGYGRKYNPVSYDYNWDSYTAKMVEIKNTKSETVLFSHQNLTKISSIYLHFAYDATRDIFLITDAAYSNAKMMQINSKGEVIRTTAHAAQAVNAIIIK